MPEYIERERLLVLAKYIANMYSPTGLAAPKIIKAIENAPKVDVVEVVRCKSCVYGKGNNEEVRLKYHFMYFCTYDDLSYNYADHFCSYGERKEGVEK